MGSWQRGGDGGAGFAIQDIVEPTVSYENLERYPELDDELRVPNFIIFVLEKIAS